MIIGGQAIIMKLYDRMYGISTMSDVSQSTLEHVSSILCFPPILQFVLYLEARHICNTTCT